MTAYKMDLDSLKLYNLGIDKEKFGRIFSFVDFGNVNYWYEKDRRDWEDNYLSENQKLIVDIKKILAGNTLRFKKVILMWKSALIQYVF